MNVSTVVPSELPGSVPFVRPSSSPRRTAGPAIVGESDPHRYVMQRADQVATTDATVLLCGETGTGKGLLAKAIHERSPRRDRAFVVVNCAALPGTLIESELFGRERGAFTGAHTTQVGRFELAHRGTIFLDEVGDLPLELQAKLLRAVQEGEVERLGSPRTIEVDVRVIAATNKDLAEEVKQGRFRQDLFYRLNVFPITLPSLRDRRSDIPLLVAHLLDCMEPVMRKRIDVVSLEAMRMLQAHDWPGNIRELENVIQRAMILSRGPELALHEAWMPPQMAAPAPVGEGTLVDFERRHIRHVLSANRWRIEGASGAAHALGMKPSTLRSRMAKLGIERPR